MIPGNPDDWSHLAYISTSHVPYDTMLYYTHPRLQEECKMAAVAAAWDPDNGQAPSSPTHADTDCAYAAAVPRIATGLSGCRELHWAVYSTLRQAEQHLGNEQAYAHPRLIWVVKC